MNFSKKLPPYISFIALFFLGFSRVQGVLASCIQPEAVYPDLSLTFISSSERLPLDYIPTGLVDLSRSIEANGAVCLKKEAGENLVRLFEAAEEDGVKLAVTSAYKGSAGQAYMYQYWLKIDSSKTEYKVAQPGFSENQLGTTVDLTDSSIKYSSLDPNFSISRGGRWMRRNAHKYGFVMSHPQKDKDTTGFGYEPWHWRYVGPDAARKILGWRTSLSDLREGGEWPVALPVGELRPISLNADAFVSIYSNGNYHLTLIAKNEDKQVSVASVSKLVTALAIKKYYKEDAEIVIKNDYLSGAGTAYRYRAGDTFRASDLLYSVLVESDNDAAVAFAEAVSEEAFVSVMNSIASRSGMNDTVFYTPTGLDFWDGGPKNNLSTPNDIATLIDLILGQHPEIMEITRTPEFTLYNINGDKHHIVENTNKLLYDTNLGAEIIGGKTGTTPEARTNLVLVVRPPQGEGAITNVILNSDDNFGDMKALISWLLKNYRWTQSSGPDENIDIMN